MWTRSGIRQGPGVGRPAQGCPDGGGGQAGDVGASDRAGTGRTTLGTLGRGAVGRDWRTPVVQEGGATVNDDACEETALLSASTGST